MAKAVVIFSGGQDSTYCLFDAIRMFGKDGVSALIFDYGQRHRREIVAARAICSYVGVESEVLTLPSNVLASTSPLTDKAEPLETYPSPEAMEATLGSRVEKTFVPMRNALFLTIAANRAVCLGAEAVFIGVCEDDNANYPDCRATFVNSQNDTINKALGGKPHVSVVAPLLGKPKPAAIRAALHNLPGCYTAMCLTHTAYSGEYPPVTQDHATVLRAASFAKANLPDPLMVRAWLEGKVPTIPDWESWKPLLTELAHSVPGNGEPAEEAYIISPDSQSLEDWYLDTHPFAGTRTEMFMRRLEEHLRLGLRALDRSWDKAPA